jgi:tellurite resistance protein
MSESEHPGGLSPEAAECFARGLYYLATIDGIDQREKTLIEEFLAESGASTTFDDLDGSTFSPLEAAMVLETTWLRRVFIKAAVAMVKVDGVFSDGERHAIGEIADAFGLSNAEFGDLEQEASRVALE